MRCFLRMSLVLLTSWMPLLPAKNVGATAPATLYLDLVKKSITDTLHRDRSDDIISTNAPLHYDLGKAQTMLNFPRLENLQFCMEQVRKNKIPGDFIETGVWRGGCTIFMRAFLKAYGDKKRKVWVADSFEGLPQPDINKYPSDQSLISMTGWFASSLEEAQANFRRYGLLDAQVCFLKGWFSQTLPQAPIDAISIMRLDGDLYESTMDGLNHLYPKLSVGGYVIIDDYFSFPMCAEAVNDFRKAHGITDPIQAIDWTAIYWQRSK